MLNIRLLILCFLFSAFATGIFAQTNPLLTFEQLVLQAEENAQLKVQAKTVASKLSLPWSIYLPEGVFIEALSTEGNVPVYSVITDLANPYNGGYTAFYEELINQYDITRGRVNYGNGNIINPGIGYSNIKTNSENRAASFLLVIESTTKSVMAFDEQNGNLLNATFIPAQDSLGTVKQARLSPWGTITISDQTRDYVAEFDTLGNNLGIFAPAGGVNVAILDNIRGHNYRNNTGNLVVTVGSSGNQNSVAEFDALGNFVGQFIAAAAGGLNSPFDIIFRTSDVLVTGSSSNAAHRYDLNGNYLNNFVTGQSFPQQIFEMANGNIAIANFSTGGGIRVYDTGGNLVSNLTGITGNRGVYQLGNGNFLTTNGAGVHEVDGTTGVLIRTVVAGVSGQYISPYDLSIIPVELTSFSAATANGTVILNWATATETNNSGFEVQRSTDKISYSNIGFVNGHGTTAEPKSYTYTDNTVNSGVYYYRLKQIDYNGAFEYSNVIEVEVGAPDNFSLEQNYPNPFNPSTIISYQMPVNGNVILKIYDVLGNEVTTLVNEFKEAGKHSIEFDASDLGSGIYFYSITAVNFTSTKKMTLIK